MDQKTLNEMTEKEVVLAISKLKIADWLDEAHIVCGSCNGYNLYTAIHKAIKNEWRRSQIIAFLNDHDSDADRYFIVRNCVKELTWE